MDVGVLDSTPEMLHNVPQPELEKLLASGLEGQVEIRKGHSFVSCVNDNDVVTTVIEDRLNGEQYFIQSKHLIACDGAKSKVREFLGIRTHCESTPEMLMTIEISADLRPVVKHRRRILYNILDPQVSGVLIGYDLSKKQTLICNFDPNLCPVDSWNTELCQTIVETAIGQKTPFQIDSFRPWALQRQIAQTYQSGNIFLAGDAAHSFPPSAGIGLNTGIADVHNLVYKIAAVHQGWATPAILDTYEQERRPVAEINSRQSIRNAQRLYGLVKRLGLTEGDQQTARQSFQTTFNDPIQRIALLKCTDELKQNFDNVSKPREYPIVVENLVSVLPVYPAPRPYISRCNSVSLHRGIIR